MWFLLDKSEQVDILLVMTNGPDIMTIARIEGLMIQIQEGLEKLSNTNLCQLDNKRWASEALYKWRDNELAALKSAFQEVETS